MDEFCEGCVGRGTFNCALVDTREDKKVKRVLAKNELWFGVAALGFLSQSGDPSTREQVLSDNRAAYDEQRQSRVDRCVEAQKVVLYSEALSDTLA